MTRPPAFAILSLFVVCAAAAVPSAQSDLDAFMKQVIERRDDNWKKLQQYVLDERESIDLRGPAGLPLWGERRDFTWFIQDGYFVRSPLKVNGVAIGESDRRSYEAKFLKREQARDKRGDERGEIRPPGDVDALIRQTREPQFISSAYFLRFKFDQGRYALVGRERLENRDVLRIEYYPQKLFAEDKEERERRERREADRGGKRKERCIGACGKEDDESYTQQLQRLMNKASRVTLWVEPASHQILKYTFDDLGWDFLPGQWLVRLESVRASMTMGEPFADVWLPRGLDMDVALALAVGDVNVHYTIDYHDYRRAEVTTRIGVVPGVR